MCDVCLLGVVLCVWSMTLLCSSCNVVTSVLRVSLHACFHSRLLTPWQRANAASSQLATSHASAFITHCIMVCRHHSHYSLSTIRQHKSFDSEPHTLAGGFGMGGGLAFKASMVSLDRRNCKYCSCSPSSSAVEPVGMASPSAVSSAALDAASRQNATCPTLLGLNER